MIPRKEDPQPPPVAASDRLRPVPVSAIGLSLSVAGMFTGVLLNKLEVRGAHGTLLALVSAILGTGFLFGLLLRRERRSLPPSGASAGPEARERRRDLRNYGVSLVACGLGVVAGVLIQRSGWGNSFGGVFAVASGAMGLACAGALLRAALRRQGRGA